MLKFIFTVILLPLIIIYLSKLIDFQLLLEAIKISNKKILLSSFMLTLLWPLIISLRWRSTLLLYKIRPEFKKVLNAVMISFTTNIFAPARTGDFIKAFVIGNQYSKTKLASTIFTERIADLFVLILIALIGSFLISSNSFLLFSLSCLILLVILIFIFRFIRINSKFVFISKLVKSLNFSGEIWTRRPFSMKSVVLFSLLNWTLASSQVYLFFIAFGVDIQFYLVCTLFPLTVLVTLVPLTPGAIGVRETAFVILFNPFVDAHISIMVSLCYFFCSSILIPILGIISNIYFRKINYAVFK